MHFHLVVEEIDKILESLEKDEGYFNGGYAP